MKKKLYTRSATISLEDSVFNQIKGITDKEDISISDWIREAIRIRFEQEGIVQDSSSKKQDQPNDA